MGGGGRGKTKCGNGSWRRKRRLKRGKGAAGEGGCSPFCSGHGNVIDDEDWAALNSEAVAAKEPEPD